MACSAPRSLVPGLIFPRTPPSRAWAPGAASSLASPAGCQDASLGNVLNDSVAVPVQLGRTPVVMGVQLCHQEQLPPALVVMLRPLGLSCIQPGPLGGCAVLWMPARPFGMSFVCFCPSGLGKLCLFVRAMLVCTVQSYCRAVVRVYACVVPTHSHQDKYHRADPSNSVGTTLAG